jgi:hypothetical protein
MRFYEGLVNGKTKVSTGFLRVFWGFLDFITILGHFHPVWMPATASIKAKKRLVLLLGGDLQRLVQ